MFRQKPKIFKRAAAVLVAAVAAFGIAATPLSTQVSAYDGTMRGLSASQIAADMGAGWNLGNSFESENNETYWGNPKTTKSMIDAISSRGFKTLRIPVRWDDNYSDWSNYTIKNDYIKRVEEVVNYGLSDGMYVIINVHHNDLQTWVSTDWNTQQRVKNELTSVWKQIGNYFKNYGDKLVFEVNNEPRCGEDWGGNSSYYDCVNQYNESARSAIRSTGGNNSKRLVLLPTYCASSDSAKLYGWKNLSSDNMVAVSIHAYKPFDFAYEGNGHNNWTNDDYNSLKSTFEEMNSVFVSKGIPVVIGEFGATEKNNYSDRAKYAKIYATFAKQYGMPCCWWDNNSYGYGAEKFGIFDRSSCSFKYGDIADAMISVYGKSSTPVTPTTPTTPTSDNQSNISLFSGNSWSSNWGQAVSVSTTRYGGNFDASKIASNGYFYVEYSGTSGEVEFIMQSTCGGASWAKVKPSEKGSVNGHYYAKYSYNNCKSAFGTSNFSGKLDKIYVGATSCSINVYSLSYKVNSSSSSSSSTTTDSKKDSYVSAFWGTSSASWWKQAASTMTSRNGGKFNAGCITSGGYFYVEYSGDEKQLELILQSWSGGANWAKVQAYEYGQANGHHFAKFSYKDCVSSFGSNFANQLDQLHIGAKNGSITVYSVCYCYPA